MKVYQYIRSSGDSQGLLFSNLLKAYEKLKGICYLHSVTIASYTTVTRRIKETGVYKVYANTLVGDTVMIGEIKQRPVL